MKIFVSYARADEQKASALASRITQLGHHVWVDNALTGGYPWWDEILAQIRTADAVVVSLSPSSLRSVACGYERNYATRLSRPILPLMLERVPPETLPIEMSRLQLVDYVVPGEEAAIRLAVAIGRLPLAPPLPNPLPDAPPVPFSYLNDLAKQVDRPLVLDDQLSLLTKLDTAMRSPDPEEREAAGSIATRLSERTDLYAETSRRLDQLNSSNPRPPKERGTKALRAWASEGSPKAPSTPAPKKSGASTGTKILAWIGAAVLGLVALGFCEAQAATSTCTDYSGYTYEC